MRKWRKIQKQNCLYNLGPVHHTLIYGSIRFARHFGMPLIGTVDLFYFIFVRGKSVCLNIRHSFSWCYGTPMVSLVTWWQYILSWPVVFVLSWHATCKNITWDPLLRTELEWGDEWPRFLFLSCRLITNWHVLLLLILDGFEEEQGQDKTWQ